MIGSERGFGRKIRQTAAGFLACRPHFFYHFSDVNISVRTDGRYKLTRPWTSGLSNSSVFQQSSLLNHMNRGDNVSQFTYIHSRLSGHENLVRDSYMILRITNAKIMLRHPCS